MVKNIKCTYFVEKKCPFYCFFPKELTKQGQQLYSHTSVWAFCLKATGLLNQLLGCSLVPLQFIRSYKSSAAVVVVFSFTNSCKLMHNRTALPSLKCDSGCGEKNPHLLSQVEGGAWSVLHYTLNTGVREGFLMNWVAFCSCG